MSEPISAEPSALEDAIREALSAADEAGAAPAICGECISRLPCDGAAVTVMASDAQRETVYASDDTIAAFERAEYTLGEGPSLLAFNQRRPVLNSHFSDQTVEARWPILVGEVSGLRIGAVFSFPMCFGVINVGVCTLYRRDPGDLTARDVRVTLDAVQLTTLALLGVRAGDAADYPLGRWLSASGKGRRVVHQATGMLMDQLHVSAEVAFARLRAAAFAEGCDLDDISRQVLTHEVRLESAAR